MNLKNYLKFVLPSMVAFAFSGVYGIVDGFFIGRNIGDAGLAAINIAYPVTALIQAAGTGIGMGGAIHFSMRKGCGDKDGAARYLSMTFILLAAACTAVTVLLAFFHKPLLAAFGAEGDILELGCDYIRVIIAGAVFQVIGTGLVPVLRNHGKSVFAMGCMVAGFVTNIVLDYLFISVFPFGMAGAAWATIIGQAVTAAPGAVLLFSKKYRLPSSVWHISAYRAREVLATGLSPFGLTLSPNIVLILMNKAAMIHGGGPAVAAYAVVSYVLCVFQLLMQGVGDGSQPLVSNAFGREDAKTAKSVCKMAYVLAAAVSLACTSGILLLREQLPPFFGASAEVTEMAADAIVVFTVGFLPVAFLRVTTSYFYAAKKNLFAYLMVYGEPALLFFLLTAALPRIWGLQGVWASVPAAQALLALTGALLLFFAMRSKETGRMTGRNKAATDDAGL